jgi:hypothetical protein
MGILVLAACQTAAPAATTTPTLAVSAAPSEPAAASPSAEATSGEESPSASGQALPSGFPSFALPSFNRDLELEAVLPNELAGVTLQKFSFRGSDVFGDDPSDPDDQQFRALIEALGATPDDYSLAVAGGDVNHNSIQIGVFRVGNVEGSRVLQALVTAGQATEPDTLVEQTTLGGKPVTKVADPADVPEFGPSFLYASGNLVFFVQSPDQNLAEQAIGLLP